MRLGANFFQRDVLEVAPQLLGKVLVRQFDNGQTLRLRITEVEAYRGQDDRACHASKGRTPRTQVMFDPGGVVYVYFIYGMYWLLNVVTGLEGDASAVLIRGVESATGPGRVGKLLALDRTFYAENLETSQRIWIENAPLVARFTQTARIGVDYAGPDWASKPWRFVVSNTQM
jgi:DNA-3-methyladenine glycosylase